MIYLRTERERRQLSLEEAAAQARIPVRYVDALERGDEEILPPGAFRRAYQRQYLDSLGLDPDSPVAPQPLEPEQPEEEETRTITVSLEEIPLQRLVVAGFLLTMAVVLGLRVIAAYIDYTTPAEVAPDEMAAAIEPSTLPTAHLRVRAIEPTRLRTRVDGIDSFQGVLDANNLIDLEGREEIEVWAADLTSIIITYNGDRIEPLGNLSRGRRLVFIQE